MSKKQAIILLLSALLLGLLMIQPFNLFCRATNKCQPIILAYYMPKETGSEYFEIFFDAKDRSKEVRFEATQRSVVMLAGDNYEVKYEAQNAADHEIKIRPKPYVYPLEAAKYIKFYECLCSREHKIKKGGQIDLSVKFRLDHKIENDPFFKDMRNIRVGYEI